MLHRSGKGADVVRKGTESTEAYSYIHSYIQVRKPSNVGCMFVWPVDPLHMWIKGMTGLPNRISHMKGCNPDYTMSMYS